MSRYALERLLGFALLFVGLELVTSLTWWTVHGADRRRIGALGPRIEAASEAIRAEREWSSRRREVAELLDEMSGRIEAGVETFPDRAAYDSLRAEHARLIRLWNAGIPEHERRNARLDSLAAEHDRLVAAWRAAYRRAYPGWSLLPRPDPPRHVAGR